MEDKIQINTDTDLLEYLKENAWGTGFVIKDVDTETEFVIDNITNTMGGQEHLVLELKHIHNDENWFKSVRQAISELLRERENYVKMSETFKEKYPDVYARNPDLIKNCIESCDRNIEYYQKYLNNE